MSIDTELGTPRKKRKRAQIVVEIPHWQINAEPGSSRVTATPPDNTESTQPSQIDWYTHHIDTHIRGSHQHVLGNLPGPLYLGSTKSSRRGPTPVPPSNAVWTWSEKSLLFASLARHSRYRPDLIANDIERKSEAEVAWYLALLERCSEVVRSGKSVQGEGDDDGEEGICRISKETRGKRRKDVKAKWGGSHIWREGCAPAAREVSDKWIKMEETLSSAVDDHIAKEYPTSTAQFEKEKSRWQDRRELRSLAKDLGELDEDVDEDLRSKNRKAAVKAGRDELSRKYELEDWFEEVGVDKFEILDRLMRPTYIEWYKKRLALEGFKVEPIATVSDQQALPDTLKQNRHKTISDDKDELEALLLVSKESRTKAQKERIRSLRNKKQSREKYRIKKLQGEGMSLEAIAQAGGADAIFASRGASRAGKLSTISSTQDSLEQVGFTEQQVAWTEIHVYRGTYRRYGRPHDDGSELSSVDSEAPVEDMVEDIDEPQDLTEPDQEAEAQSTYEDDQRAEDLNELKRIGVNTKMTDNGLEIFNYETVAHMIRELHSLQEDDTSSTYPNTTIEVLRLLRYHLLAFLTPLVYHSIVFGEQAAAQRPRKRTDELSEAGDKTSEDESEVEDGDIISDHVRLAVDLCGLGQRKRRRSTSDTSARSSVEELSTPSLLEGRNKYCPPTQSSWSLLPSLHPPDQAPSQPTAPPSQHVLDLASRHTMRRMLLRRLAPGPYLNSEGEIHYGQTAWEDSGRCIVDVDKDTGRPEIQEEEEEQEKEEERLDQVLERFDEALDRVFEESLWDGVGEGGFDATEWGELEVRWNLARPNGSHQKVSIAGNLARGEANSKVGEDARNIQAEYIKSLNEISHVRRKRARRLRLREPEAKGRAMRDKELIGSEDESTSEGDFSVHDSEESELDDEVDGIDDEEGEEDSDDGREDDEDEDEDEDVNGSEDHEDEGDMD